MILLVLWEIPLATSLATLYLGEAVFLARPSARTIARNFFRSLPQLLWHQGVIRALLMPEVLTWFVPFAIWPYLSEVILLERNPFRSRQRGELTSFRRSMVLHEGNSGDLFARWLLAVMFGVMLWASLWLTMQILAGMLLSEWKWDGLTFTLYYPLAMWLVAGYFTVARFLGYLDLRIRREGWEVELMMRAEGIGSVETTDMKDPVAGGREALNHWFGYPWYDANTDGVRRVEVQKPSNWDWLPSSIGSIR